MATQTKTPDKYDEAIAYLTEHPTEITDAWHLPRLHKAGCLFQFATQSGYNRYLDSTKEGSPECGCLTQIKSGYDVAPNLGLTNAILADPRIPDNHLAITIETLPVFAEWQRRLDKELNRQ